MEFEKVYNGNKLDQTVEAVRKISQSAMRVIVSARMQTTQPIGIFPQAIQITNIDAGGCVPQFGPKYLGYQ